MKVAVIGTGFGERVMAASYRRLGFETEVLSPRDRDGIRRACGSGVDLVSIHSPPFLHYEHVMTALDQGRNVLCDKPFGTDAVQAVRMRDRAREMGILHFVNFEFRCNPARLKAKELLASGIIGKLQHISWSMVGNGMRGRPFGWLFDKDLGGGWIGAFGSHAIDTMRFLYASEIIECGGIKRIETRHRVDDQGSSRNVTAEDAFSAWFVMADGGTVSLDTAYSTPVNLPQILRLLGENGVIEVTDDLEVAVHLPGQQKQNCALPADDTGGFGPALLCWLGQVQAALLAGRQIAPSFDDGVAVAEVIDALHRQMVQPA